MKRFLLLANILVFAGISCFIFSPLRLGTDSMRLFMMALPASIGGAYGVDQFPPFYPHLLCMLMKFGICNGVVIYGINVLSLGLGLLILRKIMRVNGCSDIEALFVLLSAQLSWCVAKHVILAQTDILLLPFFWGSVWLLMECREEKHLCLKLALAVLSMAFAALAMSIRTAAIPLFGMIFISLTGVTPGEIGKCLKRRSAMLTLILAFILVAFGGWAVLRYSGVADKGGYFYWFKIFVAKGGIRGFFNTLWLHVGEWMQLLFNLPIAKFPKWCVLPSALLALGIIAFVSFKGRKWMKWDLSLICMLYGVEIALWPYTDARFFLPIYPFVMMLIVHVFHEYWKGIKPFRFVAVLSIFTFAILGLMAWGWLAYQWSWGRDFYRHTAAPDLANDFYQAYHCRLEEVPQEERRLPLFLLKKFDPMHTMHESADLSLSDYQSFQRVYFGVKPNVGQQK